MPPAPVQQAQAAINSEATRNRAMTEALACLDASLLLHPAPGCAAQPAGGRQAQQNMAPEYLARHAQHHETEKHMTKHLHMHLQLAVQELVFLKQHSDRKQKQISLENKQYYVVVFLH